MTLDTRVLTAWSRVGDLSALWSLTSLDLVEVAKVVNKQRVRNDLSLDQLVGPKQKLLRPQTNSSSVEASLTTPTVSRDQRGWWREMSFAAGEAQSTEEDRARAGVATPF